MTKKIRIPKSKVEVKGVFSTEDFCMYFDTLNYRDVCYQCEHEVESFEEYPCNRCKILRPSHFKIKRRRRQNEES